MEPPNKSFIKNVIHKEPTTTWEITEQWGAYQCIFKYNADTKIWTVIITGDGGMSVAKHPDILTVYVNNDSWKIVTYTTHNVNIVLQLVFMFSVSPIIKTYNVVHEE